MTSDEGNAERVFTEAVHEAIRELFETCGESVQERPDPLPPPLDDALVAASVHLTGPRLVGEVTLLMTPQAALGTLPEEINPPTEEIIQDWVAELTNQIVGRTNNKLIDFNAGFRVSSPRRVRVAQLATDEQPSSGSSPEWVNLDLAQGHAHLRLRIETLAPRAWTRRAQAAPPAAAEGSLLLF